MAAAIKEGLICAECHQEFNSVSILLSHFQNKHLQEDNSIKSLIDKAKHKLVNKQQQEEVIRTTPKYYDVYDDVSPGVTRSHFQDFKRLRSSQVEHLSSEGSKLLIRLHKLVSFVGDENKRRGFEQNIVQWMEAKHVSRCPDCTESFNLLVRKHHCRLCGSILCDNCSCFINGDLAASLTSQIGPHESISKEFQLRSCRYCFDLVRLKGTTFDTNPPITQLYDKLKQLMSQCEALNSEYSSMINSVARGDNLYSMEQVTTLRNDLIKHTEKIDMLSKRMVIVGAEGGEQSSAISDSENRLRSRLRMSTINWVREFLSGLSAVPQQKEKQEEPLADGWAASVDYNFKISDQDDVIAVQIEKTRKWIVEAKKAKRTDEVEMLEASLKQLLLEFERKS